MEVGGIMKQFSPPENNSIVENGVLKIIAKRENFEGKGTSTE